MKESRFRILSNEMIAKDIYKCVLSGDVSEIKRPGQFVNIRLEGCYLRRPISVCGFNENELTIIYRVVGYGTGVMGKLKSGDELDILTGLGNGYDTSLSGDRPLLVGGGIGVPPLYQLALELTARGKEVSAVLGFNSSDEVFYENEFARTGCKVYVTTVDGSYGTKGFVTDIIKDIPHTHFYACGPEPMLRAVCRASDAGGSLSFEARMGCGFGACMGCSCRTLTGNKRICKEGPVMQKEEIIWEG